jgi:hypothetical protein
MTSQLKTASIMPTLNATEPMRACVRDNELVSARAAVPATPPLRRT